MFIHSMSLKSVGTQTGLTGFFCENTSLSSEFYDSTIPITTLVRWKYILRWPNKECQEACFFQKPQGLDKEVVELNKRKANQVTLSLKLPSFHGQNIQFCHRLWFTGSHTACSWAVQRHTQDTMDTSVWTLVWTKCFVISYYYTYN